MATSNTNLNMLSISPIDGRYYKQLSDLSNVASEFALNKFRLFVELEWFKFILSEKVLSIYDISLEDIKYLDDIVKNFDINECNQIKQLELSTNHDVKALEYYLSNILSKHDIFKKYISFIHFACTSEDINNTSYALMLKELKYLHIRPALANVLDLMVTVANKYRDIAMVSRTHGQLASPTTMGKEFFNFAYRLNKYLKKLMQLDISAKINGAVGNYNAHIVAYPAIKWHEISKVFIEDILHLSLNPYTTQIEPHDNLAEFCDYLKRINTILLDFVKDIWLYISINYLSQKILSHEVGSSVMPHKINPIDFENAEGNLGLANSLLTYMADKLPISRYQRDLSDSTVMRNIGSCISYCLIAYNSIIKGLNKLEINQKVIAADLDNSWDVLAEAIQTIMRKNYVHDAYEQLKSLTRGSKITKDILDSFIKNLDIDIVDKQTLLNLTPKDYIGLATTFDINIINEL